MNLLTSMNSRIEFLEELHLTFSRFLMLALPGNLLFMAIYFSGGNMYYTVQKDDIKDLDLDLAQTMTKIMIQQKQ